MAEGLEKSIQKTAEDIEDEIINHTVFIMN